MGKPKKRTSARKTGLRRSHLVLKLKRLVNKKSPVRIRTTKNESGKRKVERPKAKGESSAVAAKKATVTKKPAK